jgi:DNA polymerase-3 subunit epsilon
MTASLPRSPGVYWFVDARGVPLYVGKAANLRQRVRSYFAGDDRRKIGNLLRETAGVRHHVVTSTLEAAVVEARLIHRLQPRYNRQGTRWRAAPFVALTLGERFPRLKVVRAPRADGSLYLGPLPSAQHATAVVEAIQTVAPLRRCTESLGPRVTLPRRTDPCLAAQLGVALCPCAQPDRVEEYRRVVQVVVDGLTTRPDALLDPLRWRLAELAEARRFEEATLVRDRAGALAGALRRERRMATLRASGRVRLVLPGGAIAELDGGILTHATPPPSGGADQLPFDTTPPELVPAAVRGPLPPELALELATVVAWLDKEAHRVRLEQCDGTLASAWPSLPSFTPGEPLSPPKPLAA